MASALKGISSQTPSSAPRVDAEVLKQLAAFLIAHQPCVVISGAGLSTASGIPDYRSPGRPQVTPLTDAAFRSEAEVRKRYWARSFAGHAKFSVTAPNDGHGAIARVQTELGYFHHHITQNVDGLLVRSGLRPDVELLELHGNIHSTQCLNCGAKSTRSSIQKRMAEENADVTEAIAKEKAAARPDADADLDERFYSQFTPPRCETCREEEGILMPDIVFHGGSIDSAVMKRARGLVDHAASVFVVGSSLATPSAFRLVAKAKERGAGLAILNFGETRGDGLAELKINSEVADTLTQLELRLRSARVN